MRGGLLGQASILTVTSYRNRTSVVMRGRWVLANLLGAPPPPPPPDIPALEGRGHGWRAPIASRADGACTGRIRRARRVISGWIRSGLRSRTSTPSASGARRATASRSIASASFPDGTRFEGVTGLRTLLVSHKEDFVRTLTGKLLAYAIGRGLDHHDLPAIRKIARDAARHDYRWSSIITGIVKSTPFSMGRRERAESATRTGTAAGRSESGRRDDDHRRRKRSRGARCCAASGSVLALPLLDSMVPALSALQKTAGQADQPLRRDVCAERHDHEELPAADRRRGLRADADA